MLECQHEPVAAPAAYLVLTEICSEQAHLPVPASTLWAVALHIDAVLSAEFPRFVCHRRGAVLWIDLPAQPELLNRMTTRIIEVASRHQHVSAVCGAAARSQGGRAADLLHAEQALWFAKYQGSRLELWSLGLARLVAEVRS